MTKKNKTNVRHASTNAKLQQSQATPPEFSQQRHQQCPPPLRLAVFDLDYTIWKPEMYQLYGAPTLTSIDSKYINRLSPATLKQARTNKDGYILTDRRNSPICVFPGASFALAEIEKLKATGYDIQAAVASKTDAASWARTCMNHLVIDDEKRTLISCFDQGRLVEIAYGSKKEHLKRLHKKTKIPFEQMAFFDNEYGNIRSVSSLGVKCFYTPRGMTIEDWEKAEDMFGINDSYLHIVSEASDELDES